MTHDERVFYHTYTTCETPAEHAERIVKLEELLTDAYKTMDAWQLVIANSDQWGYGNGCLEQLQELRGAMLKLGIEVNG